MTRETKVGLLIGTGVILLVGIILTDHLSVARKPQPPDMTDFAGGAQDSLRPPPVTIETDQRMRQQVGEETQVPRPSAPLGQPVDDQPRDANGPQPHRAVVVVESPSAVPLTTTNASDRHNSLYHGTFPATREAESDGQPVPTVASGSKHSASAGNKTGADTGEFTFHTVQDGENLWHIAQRYYGDGRYWKSIKQANQNAVATNNVVQTYARLRIPRRTDLVQLTDFVPAAANQVFGVRGSPTTGHTKIKVLSGDTFAGLAKKHLGFRGRWSQLFETNRRRLGIGVPEQLQAGMILHVPTAKGLQPQTATTKSLISAGAAEPRSYTTQPGDTLSSIARHFLGDADRWRQIYDANRRYLTAPDTLPVGTHMLIPDGK